MKKIISFVLINVMIFSVFSGVYAENGADFSDKLAVLDGLLAECEEKGISTDYEKVNYKVIERFDDYMDEDIENSHISVDTNFQYIEELYNEAKSNLEGYISGMVNPKRVTRPDIKTMTLNGDGFYDKTGMPVYSVGYGHFETASDDIANFQDFGTSNIQIEIGPTQFTDSKLSYVKSVLENAEKNNISVNLLLSPHYFPSNLDAGIYADTGAFIKYNINAPEARDVIENYLRKLLPELKGYKALSSLILSNEPIFNTTNFEEFYTPEFQKYLKTVHGSIENLNLAYGTSYGDFSEISMPDSDTVYYNPTTPVCYDWVVFNDEVFSEWHKWMADIVEDYLPDIPKSVKLQEDYPFSGGTRSMLLHGVDLEMFDEFSDLAGNDAQDYIDDSRRYFRTMFMYDYQSSVTGKPVYNAEDHIIKDGSTDFSPNQRIHLRNNLWMGAIHGRDLSTIWVWDRRSDSSFKNSILYRPDCIAEAGKTNLDLSRLSLYVNMLQQSKPKTAIFYSKASRLYQPESSYSPKMYEAYKTCLNAGVKVGVISDLSIEQLSDYETLIIPNAEYVPVETLNKVTAFVENGGKVIYSGNVFSKDQYMKNIDNTYLLANALEYTTVDELHDIIEGDVYLIDESTNDRLENADWSYTVNGDRLYINLSSLEFDKIKYISVYKNGEKLTNLTDLISGKSYDGAVTLEGYTPQLLEYKPYTYKKPEIRNLTVDKENKILKWTGTSDYSGAKIYKVNNGYISLVNTVAGNEYEYSSYGTYLIKPLNSHYIESSGKRVTVMNDIPVSVEISNYKKTATSVSLDVMARNTANSYISGSIAVELYDEDENVVGFAYNNTAIKASGEETVSISMNVPKNAVKLVVSYIDSEVSKNLYSEEIDFYF